MKLLNQSLEIRALRTICGRDKQLSARMFSQLDENHFYYLPTKEAFKRVKNLLKGSSEIVSFENLVTDPILSESTRDILSSDDQTTIADNVEMDSAVYNLECYRKVRGLYEMVQHLDEKLNEDQVDIDELMKYSSSKLAETMLDKSMDDIILRNGFEGNADAVVSNILSMTEDNDIFIPTGFRVFDEKNGGFFKGTVALIGSTSGGGKSMTANQIFLNNVNAGYNVCLGSFEMNKHENQSRILSNLSGVPINKIATGQLTKNEKDLIAEKYKAFKKKLVEQKNYYDILVPSRGMTMEDFLLTTKGRGYDSICIDYISLLDDLDGEDQWKKLGSAVRFAKIWALTNNVQISIVVQVGKDSEIRLSKSMIDHASNAWFWVATDDSKQNGVAEIKQIKSRNQDPFPFVLKTNLSICRVYDPDDGNQQQRSDDSSQIDHMMNS